MTRHPSPPGIGFNGRPTVAQNHAGCLELFVIGNDGGLYHKRQTAPGAAWTDWAAHPPKDRVTFVGTPAIGTAADGHLQAFVTASDGDLYHIWNLSKGEVHTRRISHGHP